jgi:hypothetical protein
LGTAGTPPVSPGANLAQRKAASQSSTLTGYGNSGAELAVDGNSNGNFYSGSVAHTNYEANPWLQVDLGSAATISSIAISNRTDCCSERLNDYWVFVSNTPFNASDTPATLQSRAGTWSSHQLSAPGPTATIQVGAQGRYVRVQLSSANYLSIAEVQVMGTAGGSSGGGNLAQGKPSTQSSTLSGYGVSDAGLAVDGNTNGNFYSGSVAHTNYESNPWWQVDLGASATVQSVVIFNRTDCCSERLADYWIFVSNTPFSPGDTPATLQARAGTWSSHVTGIPSPSTSVTANTQGRYVRVQLSAPNFLSLAEVQVTGQ